MKICRATRPGLGNAMVSGWADRIVILWEEDDAKPEGRETAREAFRRITGNSYYPESKVASFQTNEGEWSAVLTGSGWVIGSTCEGGFVGVLVEVIE